MLIIRKHREYWYLSVSQSCCQFQVLNSKQLTRHSPRTTRHGEISAAANYDLLLSKIDVFQKESFS